MAIRTGTSGDEDPPSSPDADPGSADTFPPPLVLGFSALPLALPAGLPCPLPPPLPAATPPCFEDDSFSSDPWLRLGFSESCDDFPFSVFEALAGFR